MKQEQQRCARRSLAILWASVLGPGAGVAWAYVGPGAGAGSSPGLGWLGVVVVVLGGLIALSALCGVAALVCAAAQRLRRKSPNT